MKNNKLTRREFLKAVSLLSAGALASLMSFPLKAGSDRPNIIIILFDAMTALNLSLYGYKRETTPELTRFAERCTVYHAHHSASNFTLSGVASMLTGMYPWKHRAITQGGLITRGMAPYNPFSLLGSEYFRLMFSQNFWPDRLAGQFYEDIDRFLPQTQFSMRGNNLVKSWVGKDRSLAGIAFDDFLLPAQVDRVGSALLGYIYKSRVAYGFQTQRFQQGYLLGVPEVEGYELYLNEKVYEGVASEIINMQIHNQPYFAYFHLFSPHSPYRPSKKFAQLFINDGFQQPVTKVNGQFVSFFSASTEDMLSKRLLYDQQIAQIDAELGKLLKRLEQAGLLDDSYIILTSDHGEMFERGFIGHGGLMMYEPVLRIPLLIHAPNQTSRRDIDLPTSNIDILPTLLSIAGKQIPNQLEGQVLPGFGGEEDPDHPIFSMYAGENSAFLPITKAAIAMRKNKYKLIQYLGYGDSDKTSYELYNLEADSEELVDLSEKKLPVFNSLKDELSRHLSYANEHYIP